MRYLLLFTPFLLACLLPAAEPSPRTLFNEPGWPTIFELSKGEQIRITRTLPGDETREFGIHLVDFTIHHEPDMWTGRGVERLITYRVEAQVEVNGVRGTIVKAPSALPATINGLRIYLEAEREEAQTGYAKIGDMQGELRFSAVANGEPWGPESFRFPIANFKFGGATYRNAWGALVPYNQVYYHRGDDFGAYPDHLPVIAAAEGTISASPLPGGDGASNRVRIALGNGVELMYAHMNTPAIQPDVQVGKQVHPGHLLGLTGATWSGKPRQFLDPHLHFDIRMNGAPVSSWPYLVEAYLRDYNDPLVAISDVYRFTYPGDVITLDASRSIARPGNGPLTYEWRLSDGRTVSGAHTDITYDQPGLYAETLVATTPDGATDQAVVQVRVWDPAANPRETTTFGWMHHSPVRNIRVGQPVTFRQGLSKPPPQPATFHFGDGATANASQGDLTHTYTQSGIYAYEIKTTDQSGNPIHLLNYIQIQE